MIRLVKVNKYFNKKKSNEIHVINDTSIELENKGLVTFLGNSGCGKTTLLNAIGGLDKVDSGEIYIDDDRITTKSNGKKDEIRNVSVGYIFQNYNLIEDDTVFDNVAIVLRMMGIKDKKEIEERVMYILKRVGIDKYKNRPAKMLSGGERQRVGIARAIVKNPKIIIADEPTGNLDSKNTIEIMNIIKAISREKLVILVTHEREIAEFYASRIIEIVDGRIVSDKENAHNDELDYRLENKIYLQDMPVQKELTQDHVKIKYYSDKENETLEVKVVVKNNNIYLEVPKGMGEGSDAVELIDDHYKKISKDIYEDYEFNYDKLIDESFKPHYTSIFSLGTLLINGYKKIFSYSIIKKILLLGFVLASMFSIYAVSNIAGITNVTDDKFVQVNQNYLTINTAKLSPAFYEKYEDMEDVDYVLPGDSNASFIMPLDDYYQSAGAMTMVSGSLSDIDMVKKDSLISGKPADSQRGIIIDKMVIDNILSNYEVQQVGISSYEDFVGRKLELNRLGEFTISGITDQGSPSIYTEKDLFIDILCNQPSKGAEDEQNMGDVENTEDQVVNYDLMKDNEDMRITSGSAPKNDYEALINENHKFEAAIGSNLDVKINGKKLTVCGYYSDKRQDDNIYVTAKMAKYYYIGNQKSMVLSPKDKSATFEQLSSQNIKITDNYESSREQYIDSIKKQVMATLLVCGIILIISLIEIYLMLRSSFLSRIKEVGVLRAIGLKKKDIYKMFIGEIIALTTLTTLPAMAIMAYILNGISKVPMIGDQYLMNPLVFLISFAIVAVFNLLAGLLPVFNTMRNTPAEILARNDVN